MGDALQDPLAAHTSPRTVLVYAAGEAVPGASHDVAGPRASGQTSALTAPFPRRQGRGVHRYPSTVAGRGQLGDSS